MDIKQILEELKANNIEFVEEIWVQPTSNEYHVICKFPNGRCYNYYNALEKGAPLSGPFKSIDEAIKDLESNNPAAIKCWENSETESAAGNLDLTYYTNFMLSHSVNDFEKAKQYLIEDNMTNYLKTDMSLPKSARDKVELIEWQLIKENQGQIEVKTNEYLTDEESSAISEWISGQCSDGLGEGFEQQDFANYMEGDEYNPYFVEEEAVEFEEHDYVMASFDWRTNKYELKLQN